MFKVGDRVKCIDNTLHKIGPNDKNTLCQRVLNYSQDHIYIVTKVLDEKWIRFNNHRGESCGASADRFEKV